MKIKNIFSLLLIAAIYASCSKGESQNIKVANQLPIILKHQQTAKIEASATLPIRYRSQNEFHAKVSSNGIIEAQFVGETIIELISGNESKLIRVVVEPRHTLYERPKIEWGMTKSQVKEQCGKPDKEEVNQEVNAISYSTSWLAAPTLLFLFDSSDRLYSFLFRVKISDASVLIDFLKERYPAMYIRADARDALFINELTPDKITESINVSVFDSNHLMVAYIDTSDITRQVEALLKMPADSLLDWVKKTVR